MASDDVMPSSSCATRSASTLCDDSALELDAAPRAPSADRTCVLARYRLAALCCCAAFVGYAQRYGLHLAIVRMQVDLDWDRSTQGRVVASFFLGYMVAQLPAGYVAAHWGPRKSIAIGLLASSLITLLLPPAAAISPWAVSALRTLQGIAQGILFPGFAALWSVWAPPLERSRLDGLPRAGAFVGAMACNAIGGWQCEIAPGPLRLGGWQGVFHLWGAAGFGFAAVWWMLVADTPSIASATSSSRRRSGCTLAECRYIENACGEQARHLFPISPSLCS